MKNIYINTIQQRSKTLEGLKIWNFCFNKNTIYIYIFFFFQLQGYKLYNIQKHNDPN